ncbi:thiol-disulfide oxidoreductase DCC family protein [Colwellia sp. RSH04]|uniref:thiol-disulfide oxidoreductase DCC family protein n=1 Tax=Colwellia sp. RSH04 TaxID=2305464 RepID=UPI000E578FFC|nr:DUF393 domain-containing protein [Colwellia sp. RSH04]RHW77885.1 DUF393 domain-containing protein [Colwellia sp. RSH04]
MLTIFYDGNCPLCYSEMQSLKRHDQNNLIKLVNIHSNDFNTLYPEVSTENAMKILHGVYQNKQLLGLEVTHRAWTLVGKGFWVAPLNWPVIKTMSHWVYLLVAKYRHPISARLATLMNLESKQCNKGVCFDKPTNIDNRRK